MKKPSNTNIRVFSLAIACSVLLTACSTTSQRKNDTQNVAATPDVYYTVERGDLLAKISKDLTGDADNWQAIASANGITNPRKLQVGQQLVVPGALLTPSEQDTSPKAVPAAVAVKSVDRAPAQEGEDINADAVDVVITKANPNKRFVLTPLDDTTSTTGSTIATGSSIKIIGTYFPKVVYRSPQLDAKLLMRVAPGTTFPLEKLDDGWYRISTEKGIGFLRVEDGEPTSSEG